MGGHVVGTSSSPGRGRNLVRNHREELSAWRPQGRLITTLYEHKAPVNSLTVSDDSKFFITGSSDGGVIVWAVPSLHRDVCMQSVSQVSQNRKVSTLRMLENTTSFAVGTDEGKVQIYRMESTPSRQTHDLLPIKSICTKNEGGIAASLSYNTSTNENVLLYATEKGFLHIHDLRVEKDVGRSEIGNQRGLLSCMSFGHDENNVFIGTLGGYVPLYDMRFSIISNVYKHTKDSPILSLSPYVPDPQLQFNWRRSTPLSPLLLVSAGGENMEVTLFNMERNEYEILFTILDHKSPSVEVPSLSTEIPTCADVDKLILKKLEKIDWKFTEYMNQLLEKRSNTEWLYNSTNRYSGIKRSYNSGCSMSKVLSPRYWNMGFSAPYVITAGGDRKIRYYDLLKENPRSYYINSPTDAECKFHVGSLGDITVIQEEILGEREAQGGVSGLSPWQKLNGASYVGALTNQRGQNCKLANAAHTDAILDMGIIHDLSAKGVPYLVTTGRDSMVKIWA